MKYYKELLKLQCFNREDVTILTGNKNTATSLLTRYVNKGYIMPIKRNLYATIGIETGRIIPSKFKIGCKIGKNNYISHFSVYELFGLTKIKHNIVYISGETRFNPFSFNGIEYRYIFPHIKAGIGRYDDLQITDLTRTVLDNINDFEKMLGIDELLNCLENSPKINPTKMLEYLKLYDRKVLWQKVGYLAEEYEYNLRIDKYFLRECQKHIGKQRVYLYPNLKNEFRIVDKKWNLFVPPKLGEHRPKGYHKEPPYYSNDPTPSIYGNYAKKISTRNWTWEINEK